MPQLTAYADIRSATTDDVDEESKFLNYLFENKLNTNDHLLFIGVSVAVYYVIRIAANPMLKSPVKSICLFSPYFNPVSCKEVLENKRELYAQLVVFKVVLMHANELNLMKVPDKDFLKLNQVITYCEKHGDESNVDELVSQYLNSKDFECKEIIDLIAHLGKANCLNEALSTAFMGLVKRLSYREELTKVKAKIAIVHSSSDLILPTWNSKELSEFLNSHHMDNKLCITKLIDHVDLVPSQLLKESFNLIAELNYFFE
jgi:hypothetical protein